MALWIIEPHDPIIFRDGKPFGPTPGAQAKSLTFPFPSTTTGGARTRAGSDGDGRFIKSGELDAIKKIAVRGPLLVQLSDDSAEPTEWLFPAPADALIFEVKEEKTHRVKQLEPVNLPEGAIVSPMSSAGDTATPRKLKPVGLPVADPSKPAKDAPLYWYKKHFYQWLTAPSELQKFYHLSGLGHSGPMRQQRIHVSIDPETSTAKEGMLFGTNGLEFTHTDKEQKNRLNGAQRLALAIDVDEGPFHVQEGFAPLGGERRTVVWHKSNVGLPECPPELKEAIKSDKACRLILLTPAYFAQGYYPTWILSEREGVKPTLEAIAVQRPQVVSGWDFEKKGPKPTRRLAPAGTVLFLSFKGNSPEAIEAWIEKTWMQCVSDDVEGASNYGQDRLDGFGLAVLGRWVSPEAVKEISVKERA